MPTLQEMMGDSYKEGMSVEDINNFFTTSSKNFKDISTGNYVDKGKFDNKVNELTQQLKAANDQLNGKLTDDEKNQKTMADKDKEIERLTKALKDNTLFSNKNSVISSLSSSRETLGIKEDDKEFLEFVDNIVSEDSTKSTDTAKYISKIVKDAYEKGKKDATKDAMGDLGKGKGSSEGTGTTGDGIESLGKRLAEEKKKTQTINENYNYFK